METKEYKLLLQIADDMRNVKTDIGELKIGLARLEARTERLEERMDRLEERMDRLEKTQDEFGEMLAELNEKVTQTQIVVENDLRKQVGSTYDGYLQLSQKMERIAVAAGNGYVANVDI